MTNAMIISLETHSGTITAPSSAERKTVCHMPLSSRTPVVLPEFDVVSPNPKTEPKRASHMHATDHHLSPAQHREPRHMLPIPFLSGPALPSRRLVLPMSDVISRHPRRTLSSRSLIHKAETSELCLLHFRLNYCDAHWTRSPPGCPSSSSSMGSPLPPANPVE